MSTTLFIILFRIHSGRHLLPLLLWRVVEAGKPPLPEVPKEDVEAVPPGGWYHLLLQVRKMVLQRRNYLRARIGPEADRGYLTLREGATRYGQIPRRHLLAAW